MVSDAGTSCRAPFSESGCFYHQEAVLVQRNLSKSGSSYSQLPHRTKAASLAPGTGVPSRAF
jgi:hypothetical protein